MAQERAFLQGQMGIAIGGHTHRYDRVVICINAMGGAVNASTLCVTQRTHYRELAQRGNHSFTFLSLTTGSSWALVYGWV